MAIAYGISTMGSAMRTSAAIMLAQSTAIFAFGLVAFGFLGMGPVTIAVDSYGPVTDNAQSVYELSLIEEQPGMSRRTAERSSASTPISSMPRCCWKKMTVPATHSRQPPSRC